MTGRVCTAEVLPRMLQVSWTLPLRDKLPPWYQKRVGISRCGASCICKRAPALKSTLVLQLPSPSCRY